MGHVLFCILHFFAVLFGFVFLFVTIPAHIIYSVIKKKKQDTPPPLPKYKICPKCQTKNRVTDYNCINCGSAL